VIRFHDGPPRMGELDFSAGGLTVSSSQAPGGGALRKTEKTPVRNPGISVRIPLGNHKSDVKRGRPGCAIVTFESGAVSLLLLLLARAGVHCPGSLCVYEASTLPTSLARCLAGSR